MVMRPITSFKRKYKNSFKTTLPFLITVGKMGNIWFDISPAVNDLEYLSCLNALILVHVQRMNKYGSICVLHVDIKLCKQR